MGTGHLRLGCAQVWLGECVTRGQGRRGTGTRARTRGCGITCREGELDLLLDHLEGHEVMLLIEAPVVQQQPIALLGGKPEWEWGRGQGGASFTPSSSAELLKTTTVTPSTAASSRHPPLAWLVPLEGRETHPEKRVS